MNNIINKIFDIPRSWKVIFLASVDSLILYFGLFTYNDFQSLYLNEIILFLFSFSIAAITLKIYTYSVRNLTLRDLARSGLIFFFLNSIIFGYFIYYSQKDFNLSSILYVLLNTNIFIVFRLGLRAVYRYILKWSSQPVVIFGINENTINVLHSLFSSKYFRPVALICIDSNVDAKRIGGIPVFQAVELESVLIRYRPKIVFTADNIDDQNREMLFHHSFESEYAIKQIPVGLESFTSASQLGNIDLSSFLRRSNPGQFSFTESGIYAGKTVLVSGAGGSIGSQLCLLLAESSVGCLLLVDSSEFAMFNIETRLKRDFPSTKLVPIIQDINNSLENVFSSYSVQIVFHAAAQKHVPLCEVNVHSALATNVLGTFNILHASHNHGVQDFLLISTDKAVRPTNIMGASKRLAELVCTSFASDKKANFNNMTVSAVRFGNVLGSSGSVLPTFERQISAGGPVTVTHKEATRYFMTIKEAAFLVLQSASLKNNGAIHLLDMGSPIKIVDLAEAVIRVMGYTPVISPREAKSMIEMQITFCGLRPGEKLYEELLIDKKAKVTELDKIRISFEPNSDYKYICDEVSKLRDLILSGSSDDLKKLMRDLPLAYRTASHSPPIPIRDTCEIKLDSYVNEVKRERDNENKRLKEYFQNLYHKYLLITRSLTMGARVLVHDKEKNFILVKHSYGSFWYLPGGGVEISENTLTAAKREVREETGILLKNNLRLVSVLHNKVVSKRDHVVFYEARVPVLEQLIKPKLEISEIKVCSPYNLPSNIDPLCDEVIKKFFNILK